MRLKHLLMSSAVAALLAGAATAQETTGGTGTGTMTNDTATTGTTDPNTGAAAVAPEYTTLEEMTVGDVLGTTVISADGESVGEIDYVIQGANGASAVIGIGGFLGLGEYTVALPLSDFEYDPDQQVLTLNRDKASLEAEPEYDESGAESLPDETPVADLMPAEQESTPGAAAESGSTEEGAAGAGGMSDDGAAEEGAAEEGAATDDSSEEGSTASGSSAAGDTSQEGSSASGTSGAGATSEEGAAEEGTAQEGATEEGAPEEGATEEGATEEGATEEGTTSEEGSSGGSAADDAGSEEELEETQPSDG